MDNRKIFEHTAEMALHSEGTAQFLNNLFCGRFITKEQARETIDFLIAKMKRDIESYPYATSEEKDEEIHFKESIMNMVKASMGL